MKNICFSSFIYGGFDGEMCNNVRLSTRHLNLNVGLVWIWRYLE